MAAPPPPPPPARGGLSLYANLLDPAADSSSATISSAPVRYNQDASSGDAKDEAAAKKLIDPCKSHHLPSPPSASQLTNPPSPALPTHPSSASQILKASETDVSKTNPRGGPVLNNSDIDRSSNSDNGSRPAAEDDPRRLDRDDGRRRLPLRRAPGPLPPARRPPEEEEEEPRPARRDELGRHLRSLQAHKRRGVPPQRRAHPRGPGVEAAPVSSPPREERQRRQRRGGCQAGEE